MVAVVNIPAVSTPCISSGVLICTFSGAPSTHLLIVAYVGSLSIMLGFDSTFNQTVFWCLLPIADGTVAVLIGKVGHGGMWHISAPRRATFLPIPNLTQLSVN